MWTEEDSSLLIALLVEEAEECGGCGHPLEVSTDPKTKRTWRVERHTCEACRMLEAETENDNEAARRKRGVKYLVRRSD